MHDIINPIDPSRVRMVWQSVNGADRNKYHVGDLIRAGGSVALFYRLSEPDFASATKAGFMGYPAFSHKVPVHHANVLELLTRRLPPRNRSDYKAFLYKNGLGNFPGISDFAMLGYSGARLPGDGFTFEIDFSIERPPFQFFSEISGFRYYDGMHMDMENLRGQPTLLIPEPNNIYDAQAIQVFVQGKKIGYIPRTQAPLFKTWLSTNPVMAIVSRIEGPPARPLVFLYVAVGSPHAPSALLPSNLNALLG